MQELNRIFDLKVEAEVYGLLMNMYDASDQEGVMLQN